MCHSNIPNFIFDGNPFFRWTLLSSEKLLVDLSNKNKSGRFAEMPMLVPKPMPQNMVPATPVATTDLVVLSSP